MSVDRKNAVGFQESGLLEIGSGNFWPACAGIFFSVMFGYALIVILLFGFCILILVAAWALQPWRVVSKLFRGGSTINFVDHVGIIWRQNGDGHRTVMQKRETSTFPDNVLRHSERQE